MPGGVLRAARRGVTCGTPAGGTSRLTGLCLYSGAQSARRLAHRARGEHVAAVDALQVEVSRSWSPASRSFQNSSPSRGCTRSSSPRSIARRWMRVRRRSASLRSTSVSPRRRKCSTSSIGGRGGQPSSPRTGKPRGTREYHNNGRRRGPQRSERVSDARPDERERANQHRVLQRGAGRPHRPAPHGKRLRPGTPGSSASWPSCGVRAGGRGGGREHRLPSGAGHPGRCLLAGGLGPTGASTS